MRLRSLLAIALILVLATTAFPAQYKETDILAWTGTAWTRLVKGFLRTAQSATHATLVIGGGYGDSGLSVAATGALTSNSTAQFDGVITSGKTGSNGGLVVCSTGAGATTFSVTGASGNTLIAGTADITGATTVTGAVALNGGVACDSTAFVIADTTGELTGTGPKHYVSVPLLSTAAATTARTGVFIAHRACTITKGSISFVAFPGSSAGTCVFTLGNYDLSATTSDNLLSTTNIDVKAKTAYTTIDLTLTSTSADKVLADGDYVYASLVNDNSDATAGTGGVLTLEYTLQ